MMRLGWGAVKQKWSEVYDSDEQKTWSGWRQDGDVHIVQKVMYIFHRHSDTQDLSNNVPIKPMEEQGGSRNLAFWLREHTLLIIFTP